MPRKHITGPFKQIFLTSPPWCYMINELAIRDKGSTLSRNQKQEDNMFSLSPHVAAAVARPRLALALADSQAEPG